MTLSVWTGRGYASSRYVESLSIRYAPDRADLLCLVSTSQKADAGKSGLACRLWLDARNFVPPGRAIALKKSFRDLIVISALWLG